MKWLILISLCTPLTALARLGETAHECVSRYGQPVQINKAEKRLTFRKNGFVIVCFFHGQHCDRIAYQRPALVGGVAMSDTEIELLLASNGRDWQRRPVLSLHREWVDAAGNLAHYDVVDDLFYLTTAAAHERFNAAQESRERAVLDEF